MALRVQERQALQWMKHPAGECTINAFLPI
jgi:hypothetical protein